MERLSMMAGPNRAIVGEPAPSFTCKAVVNGRIREISLQNIKADKQWLVLVFFPMAWSIVCPTEVLAFDARLSEFASRDCTVLFVSTDSEHVLKAWTSTDKQEGGLGGTRVPLVADRSHRMSRDYGVLIEEEGITQRATFIIDPSGLIRSSSVNDANIGRSVDETKRLVDALKFTDEYGEACPVDWKAGQRGLRIPTLAYDVSELDSERPSSALGLRPSLNRGMSWTTSWVKTPVTPKSPRNGGGRVDEYLSNGRPKSLHWSSEEDAANGEFLAK